MAGDIIQRFGVQIFGDTKGLDKSLKGVDKKLGGLGKSLKGLGKLIGTSFSVYGIKKIADMGKQMSNLAAQTGMSVASLSAMSSAFRMMGSNANTASRVIGKMNQAAIGLNLGRPETAARLASMGISVIDRKGGLKSGKALMMETANWARQKSKEGIDRRMIIAVLEELGFDAASASMAISGGAGAFYAKEAEARKYGAYMTDYETNNLKQLSTDIDLIGQQLKYLGGSILAPFADFIKPVMDDIKIGFGDFLGSIRNAVKEITGNKPAWEAAKQEFKESMQNIWRGVEGSGDVVAWLVNAVDTLMEYKKNSESIAPAGYKKVGTTADGKTIWEDLQGNQVTGDMFARKSIDFGQGISATGVFAGRGLGYELKESLKDTEIMLVIDKGDGTTITTPIKMGETNNIFETLGELNASGVTQ